MSEQPEVRVWDPLVRLTHWSLAIGIVLSFVTAERWPEIHEAIGYTIGGIIVVRVLWGFIGSQHARFSDFAYGPSAVRRYLVALMGFKGRRYLGHSPAGGAMVMLLLALVSTIVVTGILTEIQRESALPPAVATAASSGAPSGLEASSEEHESVVGQIHEAAANVLIVFVSLHIAGVLVASLLHRENLVAAMFTGRKRLKSKPGSPAAGS